VAPTLFGHLIGSGSRMQLFLGYVLAAVLMFGAAIVEMIYGVKAERTGLEELAAPLSALVYEPVTSSRARPTTK
jgi:hypothetical protein